MMRLAIILLSAALSFAETADIGTLFFHDEFERIESQEEKDEIGNGWDSNSKTRAKGNKQVDLRDGAMYLYIHKEANHAISVSHTMEFTNGSVGMRFRLDRPEDSLGLDFADLSCKEVHAGHLFAAWFSPKQVWLRDLKTGAMNLKMQEARSNKSLSVEQQAVLKASERIFPRTNETAVWHTLLVTVNGDEMTAFIDDVLVGSMRSPGIAHPTKKMLRLSVPKNAVADDVKFWRRE